MGDADVLQSESSCEALVKLYNTLANVLGNSEGTSLLVFEELLCLAINATNPENIGEKYLSPVNEV